MLALHGFWRPHSLEIENGHYSLEEVRNGREEDFFEEFSTLLSLSHAAFTQVARNNPL